jgi:hypothetical protein
MEKTLFTMFLSGFSSGTLATAGYTIKNVGLDAFCKAEAAVRQIIPRFL